MGYKNPKYEFRPLDGYKISSDLKEDAKRDISEYVIESILARLGDGLSPVSGEGSFKKLSKKYSKIKGTNLPNLELTGDLLDSLNIRVKGNLFTLLVEGQAGKSEGHNQHDSGLDHPLPKRRFIPSDDQGFVQEIERGIEEIAQEYEDRSRDEE